MTERHRKQLVRDLAALIAKYGIDEFTALFADASRMQVVDEIGHILAGLQDRGAPRHAVSASQAKQRRTERAQERLRDTDAGGANELTDIQTVLLSAPDFRSHLDLRSLADSIGMKEQLNRDRRVASRQIVDFAAMLPTAVRQDFVARVKAGRADREGSFANWAKTIMGKEQGAEGNRADKLATDRPLNQRV